jgi:xanthine dehydrogenase accessory factor
MAHELYQVLRTALRASTPVATATIVEGPRDLVGAMLLIEPATGPGDGPAVVGSLGDPDLDRVVERDALGELEAGRTGSRHYGPHGEARQSELTVFIESFAPPPHMVIFGAVDFTAALGRVAKILGYRVTVCDPRPVFATRQRFPMADEVAVDWPNRFLARAGPRLGPRDAACVLTHDAKLDVPAIVAALATRVGYIGVMGSRRTHAERVTRLREAGVDEAGLARLMAPIGLDLAARTPEETAVAICAEIIALRSGRRPPSLRDRDGPIHADRTLIPAQRPAAGRSSA